ncbi:unnamed protein product [Owenia fusiformis]|uniref:Mediator of RNA polymerase II transcription subunit 24 n=1 Tax=Owenia fusiformis TaxID=6347 RepID=A0A8J1UHZ9_OWEFU|nr:unnamed protein product [Owenia fusiformis]
MVIQKAMTVKSVLLKAWRERWTDLQFSIALKKTAPFSSNPTETSQSLAELILQQALIGSSPNNLVLSYLKHCLSTQVVTISKGLKSVMKYDDVGMPHCLKSLLNLVHCFTPRLSCYGNTEDPLSLAKTLLHLLQWLLHLIHKSLQKLNVVKHSPEHCAIIEKACSIMKDLIESPTNKAMLYIAKLDDPETYRQIEQTESNARGTLGKLQSAHIPSNLRDHVDFSLNLLTRISISGANVSKGLVNVDHMILNISINTQVMLEVLLNTTGDTQAFIQQMLLIEKLHDLSRPQLYCEILRSCFMGLLDANHVQGQEELKWAAFTFLKLPNIFLKLQRVGNHDNSTLEAGIDMLLRYTSLLDLTDTKCNCDNLQMLLKELCNKQNLITEVALERLVKRRTTESQKPKTTEHTGGTQPSTSLILRAEPTVVTILKTLDADYSKTLDSLQGVLGHMISGKSFELINMAATATGKLQSFTIKLIKFNEFTKHSSGEGSKTSQTRALLFDITFLMLCHITQLHGSEIVASHPESKDAFFTQWALKCLPEDGKFKCLDLFPMADANKVEVLLGQFNPGGEFKTSLTKWHEVCTNAPFAIEQFLLAWEQGAITETTVKSVLDNIKSKVCCIPVVVCAWLTSYIHVLSEEHQEKAREVLRYLLTPMSPESVDANFLQYYSDRAQLLGVILKTMTKDIVLNEQQGHVSNLYSLRYKPLRTDKKYQVLLQKSFTEICTKGHVTITMVHLLEDILKITGAEWFCSKLIKELVNYNSPRPEEMTQVCALIYSLFHLDLEPLTLSFLHDVVPNLLQGSVWQKSQPLVDPRGEALAKLCVMCITACHNQIQATGTAKSAVRSRKRSRREFDIDDQEQESTDSKPSKLPKLHSDGADLTLDSEGFNIDLLAVKEEQDSLPTYDLRDPLNKAIANLFNLLNHILNQPNLRVGSQFAITFIEEALKVGQPHSKYILQFMPLSMVGQMMKMFPRTITAELLLSVCDLSQNTGKLIAAKSIAQLAVTL